MNGTIQQVTSVPDAFAGLVAERLAAPRDAGFSLFLSGGHTARACYQRLAELTTPDRDAAGSRTTGNRRVDWTTVDIYLGDERCVPPDDADSNHKMITEALLDTVGPVRSDHPMYRSGSPEDAASAYQGEIEALTGFDLVHLGLGPDGHCASLFPDSDALAVDDPAVQVVANRDPNANNPHDRVTLTLPGIARARLVVFTVSGPSKRGAFARLVAGADLPAARVTAGQVLWLVDADAAGGGGRPD
ncbi:MAG: 6-phosphogluconolactonase [Acidimicrobiales bacterium]|jgi:6-phosphogluconolactonase